MASFAPGWVTSGWGRGPKNDEWIELGAVEGVTCDPAPPPPTLAIHDVAAMLNKLELRLRLATGHANQLQTDLEKHKEVK